MIWKEAIEYYRLLELELWSPILAIKKRYRELCFKYHPDRFHHSPRQRAAGEEKLKRINPAYQRLVRHLESSPSALQNLKSEAGNADGAASQEQEAQQAWWDYQERLRKEEEQREKEEERRKQGEKLRRQRERARKAAEKARELEKKTTRERWLKKVMSMAELGIPEFQYALGQMFGSGHLVKKDKTQEAKWYRLAAEQGFARAQSDLAFLYEWGKGIKRDEEEAVKWYHLAACQGLADAQEHLGFLYFNGFGIRQDYELATKWYGQAARQGHTDAQRELSECFRNGKGVPVDLALADYWLRASKKKRIQERK